MAHFIKISYFWSTSDNRLFAVPGRSTRGRGNGTCSRDSPVVLTVATEPRQLPSSAPNQCVLIRFFAFFLVFTQCKHNSQHNTDAHTYHTDANTLTQTQTPVLLHIEAYTQVAPRRVPFRKAHHHKSRGNCQPRGRPPPTTCGEARVTTLPTLITHTHNTHHTSTTHGPRFHGHS